MTAISDNLCICYLLEKEHLFTGVSRMPPNNILHCSLSIYYLQGHHQKGDTSPGLKDVP